MGRLGAPVITIDLRIRLVEPRNSQSVSALQRGEGSAFLRRTRSPRRNGPPPDPDRGLLGLLEHGPVEPGRLARDRSRPLFLLSHRNHDGSPGPRLWGVPSDRLRSSGLVAFLTVGLLMVSCSGPGQERVSMNSPDLQFREEVIDNRREVGESCAVPGSRVRSTRSHVVSVVDRSGKGIDINDFEVRSREIRVGRGPAVEPATFKGPDEISGPPPGVNVSPSPFPYMDDYLFLLAPVLFFSRPPAEIRPETRILAMPADSSGSEVRKALDEVSKTPIPAGPSGYFTFAYVVDEKVTTKDLSDLTSSEADNAKEVELIDDRLDELLVSSDDVEFGIPVKGIMIELDPPAEGLQTEARKLMLWYRGKGTPSSSGAEFECKRG